MTLLSVPDMSCGHCKASVEAALSALPGAAPITVDPVSYTHLDVYKRQAMMRASTVAAPTCSTCITKAPVPFTVPPVSRSPSVFSCGKGSPVSIAQSTAEWPLITTPSAGIRSPGRICTR